MVGIKLYQIISNLENSNKRTVINLCKRHADKRHLALAKVLKTKVRTKEGFSALLDKVSYEISPDSQNDAERQKNLRRFVDFSAKVIENVKIQDYLSGDSKTRNFLLAQAFDNSTDDSLKKLYLSKSEKISKDDYWIEMTIIQDKINSQFKSHAIKDLEAWKHLVKDKYLAVNKYYQLEMAKIYDDISRSFLDDNESVKIFGELFRDDQNIMNIIQTADRNIELIYYRLAQARYSFTDPVRFKELMDIISLYFDKGVEDKEEEIQLKRKYYFLQFLYYFHHGSSPDQLLNLLNVVIDIDIKTNVFDSKMFFYQFLMRTLSNNSNDEYRKKFEYLFERDQTEFLNEFSIAIELTMERKWKKAKQIFSELAYCKNPFVAIWSRLAEIILNIKLGNGDLSEHLIDRCKRQIKLNKSRVFTLNSNINALNEICKHRGVAILKLNIISGQKLTPVHSYLLSLLEDQE